MTVRMKIGEHNLEFRNGDYGRSPWEQETNSVDGRCEYLKLDDQVYRAKENEWLYNFMEMLYSKRHDIEFATDYLFDSVENTDNFDYLGQLKH